MGLLQQLLEVLPASEGVVAEAQHLQHEALALLKLLFATRLVFYVVAAFVLYKVWQVVFQPLNLVRRQHEIGYITKPRQTMEHRSEEVSRRRLRGDLPPVYPNGWYELCRSDLLRNGDVKQVTALGKELCVFRTECGKVGVIDAYCPHLGANIAAGGTVKGDCVQCPFHGWEFDTEGKCNRVPYSADKPPTNAHTKAYRHMEINDQILLWFHAEGEEPTWTPPPLEHVNTRHWTFRGLTQHFINAHIQEVPENAADVAHLNYLHGPCILSGNDLRSTHKSFQFLEHRWEASWAPSEKKGEEHISVLHLLHYMTFLGIRLPPLDFHVTATQIGPALVYLTWTCFMGSGVFVQSLTPEEPLLQVLTHRVYAAPTVPTLLAKFYMAGEATQVERDGMVWANKRYNGKPVLAKEDQLIARHRRWYSQFYTENSPRYEDQASLEW